MFPILPIAQFSNAHFVRLFGLLLVSFALLAFTGCGDDDPKPKKVKLATELLVELETLQVSDTPTLENIQPYSDALVLHEYRVSKVLNGDAKLAGSTVRVAHWAIIGEKPQALKVTIGDVRKTTLVPFDSVYRLNNEKLVDTLEISEDDNILTYLDLGQSTDLPSLPENIRYYYGLSKGHRIETYWKTRGQIKLIVMGTSHAETGVDAKSLYADENTEYPCAFNLSQAGSSYDLQKLLMEDYILPLPALEWVVWGISPRIFNTLNAGDIRHAKFINSPGHQFDRKHWKNLWPVSSTAREDRISFDTLKDLRTSRRDLWGGCPKLIADGFGIPEPSPSLRKDLVEKFRKVEFHWNEPAWSHFASLVEQFEKKGVRVCLFTVPFHPVSLGQPAVDDDKTDLKSYRQLVNRLAGLAKKHPGVLFEDIGNAGKHEFMHEDFADHDHLNERGAAKLTSRILGLMEQSASK